MTIRQITSTAPVPLCEAGHGARLMEDGRRLESGGGHFVECRCSHTKRHPGADLALQEWDRLHAARVPHSGGCAVQLGLSLGERTKTR